MPTITVTVPGLSPGLANYYASATTEADYVPNTSAGGSLTATGVETTPPGSYTFTFALPDGDYRYDIYQFFGSAPAAGDQSVVLAGRFTAGAGGSGGGGSGAPAIVPGTLSSPSIADSGATFTLSGISGGTPPYLSQLQRSPAGGSSWADVGDPRAGTSVTLTDAGASPGTAYLYRAFVADSDGQFAVTATAAITTTGGATIPTSYPRIYLPRRWMTLGSHRRVPLPADLPAAIVARFSGAAANAWVAGGITYGQARDGTPTPYAAFHYITSVNRFTTSSDYAATPTFQFDAYGRDEHEAQRVLEAIKAAFHPQMKRLVYRRGRTVVAWTFAEGTDPREYPDDLGYLTRRKRITASFTCDAALPAIA